MPRVPHRRGAIHRARPSRHRRFRIILPSLQHALGATQVYGIFQPRHINAGVGFGGPFINGNHAGHLFLLAGMTAVALMFSKRTAGHWKLLVVVFVLCVKGMMVKGSRGALLALAVAMTELLVSQVRSKRWSLATVVGMAGGAFAVIGQLASASESVFLELAERRICLSLAPANSQAP